MTLSPWSTEEKQVARPPENIAISEYGRRNIILGRDSAIKGNYQPDLTPFFIPVMNAAQDDSISEIVVCKPAQIGGTQAFLVIDTFFACELGVPIALVFSDQETAEDIVRKRLMPMFEDTPYFKALKDPALWKVSDLQLRNSGAIRSIWASSVAKLGTHPYCLAHADEIDKPGWGRTSEEASAISLLRERLETYGAMSKYLKTSTPTNEDGNIIQELKNCDAIFDWHCPCPECKQLQPLRWSRGHAWGFPGGRYLGEDENEHEIGEVVWTGGSGATRQEIRGSVGYKCGACDYVWSETDRRTAIRRGRYVSRTLETGYESKVGFHQNRLISPFSTLEKMADIWCEIHRRQEAESKVRELQGFINSTLAEPWAIVIDEIKQEDVLAARIDSLHPGVVPPEAVAVTMAIDVQPGLGCFYFVARAWAKDFTSWLIDHGQIRYDWEELARLLFESPYRVWRAGIDLKSGVRMSDNTTSTDETYDFVRRFGHMIPGKVCAMFGGPPTMTAKVTRGRDADYYPSGKRIPIGIQTFQFNGHYAKIQVRKGIERAAKGENFQPFFLNNAAGDEYSAHLTAERLEKDKHGNPIWVQMRKRNDFFDCEAINYVLVQPEFPLGGINLISGTGHFQPKSDNDQAARPVLRAGGRLADRRRWRG